MNRQEAERKVDAKDDEMYLYFRSHFDNLELALNKHLQTGRAKAIVLTKLDEAFMWVRQSIQDKKIAQLSSTASVDQ